MGVNQAVISAAHLIENPVVNQSKLIAPQIMRDVDRLDASRLNSA